MLIILTNFITKSISTNVDAPICKILYSKFGNNCNIAYLTHIH